LADTCGRWALCRYKAVVQIFCIQLGDNFCTAPCSQRAVKLLSHWNQFLRSVNAKLSCLSYHTHAHTSFLGSRPGSCLPFCVVFFHPPFPPLFHLFRSNDRDANSNSPNLQYASNDVIFEADLEPFQLHLTFATVFLRCVSFCSLQSVFGFTLGQNS
jgi:hypothetical protein